MVYYLNSDKGAEPVTREDQIRLAALELAIGSRGMIEPATAEIVTRAEAFRAFLAGAVPTQEIHERVAKSSMTLDEARTHLTEGRGGDR